MPSRLRRLLAALWISLGVHLAVIALVQVAPPAAMPADESVIEARLVPRQENPPVEADKPPAPEVAIAVEPPQEVAVPAPGEVAEALPIAPIAPPPAPPPLKAEPAAPAVRPADRASANPPAEPAPSSPPEPAAASPAALAPAPLATITSSVDLTYYSAREVDVHPRALREIVPEYPAMADHQRQSGNVRLKLKLEADGRISDIEVVSASPPDLFEESALNAFRDVRFAPAQKNGRPVRALVLIEVVYDWEGRHH
jgi:protein TonB